MFVREVTVRLHNSAVWGVKAESSGGSPYIVKFRIRQQALEAGVLTLKLLEPPCLAGLQTIILPAPPAVDLLLDDDLLANLGNSRSLADRTIRFTQLVNSLFRLGTPPTPNLFFDDSSPSPIPGPGSSLRPGSRARPRVCRVRPEVPSLVSSPGEAALVVRSPDARRQTREAPLRRNSRLSIEWPRNSTTRDRLTVGGDRDETGTR